MGDPSGPSSDVAGNRLAIPFAAICEAFFLVTSFKTELDFYRMGTRGAPIQEIEGQFELRAREGSLVLTSRLSGWPSVPQNL